MNGKMASRILAALVAGIVLFAVGCGGGAPGQGDSYGGSSAQSSSGSDSEAFPGDTETGASGDKNEEVTVMYMYIGDRKSVV